MTAVSALGALCLVLAAALAWTLLRKGGGAPAGAQAEGWKTLDGLLSMLLSLQERGVAHTGTVSREQFCRAVLDSACQLMRCERGSVMVWDEDRGCLRVIAACGAVTLRDKPLELKPGEGVAGQAFAEAKAVFIENPKTDPRY